MTLNTVYKDNVAPTPPNSDQQSVPTQIQGVDGLPKGDCMIPVVTGLAAASGEPASGLKVVI